MVQSIKYIKLPKSSMLGIAPSILYKIKVFSIIKIVQNISERLHNANISTIPRHTTICTMS